MLSTGKVMAGGDEMPIQPAWNTKGLARKRRSLSWSSMLSGQSRSAQMR